MLMFSNQACSLLCMLFEGCDLFFLQKKKMKAKFVPRRGFGISPFKVFCRQSAAYISLLCRNIYFKNISETLSLQGADELKGGQSYTARKGSRVGVRQLALTCVCKFAFIFHLINFISTTVTSFIARSLELRLMHYDAVMLPVNPALISMDTRITLHFPRFLLSLTFISPSPHFQVFHLLGAFFLSDFSELIFTRI